MPTYSSKLRHSVLIQRVNPLTSTLCICVLLILTQENNSQQKKINPLIITIINIFSGKSMDFLFAKPSCLTHFYQIQRKAFAKYIYIDMKAAKSRLILRM